MSVVERDDLLRLIKQFGEAHDRIVGLRDAGNLDEARRVATETLDAIGGSVGALLDQVDARTVAGVLGQCQKVVVYASFAVTDASSASMSGNVRGAQNRRRLALELYLEASGLGELDADSRADVEVLRQKVDLSQLDIRYRELLDRLPQRR